MTRATVSNSLLVEAESLIPATVQSVCRCPARSDYVELCFDTAEGSWTWCFPEPTELSVGEVGVETLAITVGPYGARARHVEDGRLGFALPSSEAMPLILGGARTYVARKLVKRGW